MTIRYGFIFFLLLSIHYSLLSQEFSYKQYTVQDGLVQSQVVCLFQDSKGFIWAGTKGGVSRFDGMTFLNFNHINGLPSNLTRSILEDEAGTVWLLTSEGLASYNGKQLQGYPTKNFPYLSMPSHAISLAAGQLIIPVADMDGNWKFFQFSNGEYLDITSDFPAFNLDDSIENKLLMLSDRRDGSIWIASQADGVFKITANHTLKIRERGFYLQALFTGRNHVNYLFINDTLFSLEEDRMKFIFSGFYKERPFPITSLTVDPSGTIYYCGDEYQVRIYDHGTNLIDKLTFNGIDILHADAEENLWIGSESGLYRLLSTSFTNYIPGKCEINEMIWSITENPAGGLLFMSYMYGIQSFDGTSFAKVTGYEHLFSYPTINFYMGAINDRERVSVLPVTHNVAIKFDGKRFYKFLTVPFGPAGLFMFEDSIDHCLYATSTEGIFKHSADGNTSLLEIHPGDGRSKNAVSVVRDKLSRIWFGGFNGISLLDGDSVVHLPAPHLPFDLGGNCMLVDRRQNIWIGNADGLYLYDYDTFTKFDVSELKSMVTSLALIGDSALLVGDIKGLNIIDLKDYYEKGLNSIRHFGPDNGFQGTEVGQNAFFRDRQGDYWIACNDRVIRFDPARLRSNDVAPSISLSDVSLLNDNMEWVRINGKGTFDEKKFSLTNDQKNLRFEFTGISTTYPEAVKYSRYLEGYDAGWSEAEKERSVVYTNLPPGKYHLWLKASNADGVWSEKKMLLSFHIIPAFYQRTVFWIAIFTALSVLLVLSGIFISNRRKRQQQERLEMEKKMAQLQLISVKNQIDPHFTYNAMNSVASVILKEDKELAYRFFVKFASLIRGIMRTSDQLVRTLDDEILFVKDYLELQKFRFRDRFDYEIHIGPEVKLSMLIPKMAIQTFAENALKHGILHLDRPGHLSIRIDSEMKMLVIRVEDDGIGRERAMKMASDSTGRGLSILKGYFDYYNRFNHEKIEFTITDLKDNNDEPCGTRILVKIPEGLTL